MPHSPLVRRKIEDWDRTIDVNIRGVLYGIAAALPHMQRQKSGRVINVSSVAGHKVSPNGAVYAATKHAVRALSEGLRQEVKPWNIRTTVISPGGGGDGAAGGEASTNGPVPPCSSSHARSSGERGGRVIPRVSIRRRIGSAAAHRRSHI